MSLHAIQYALSTQSGLASQLRGHALFGGSAAFARVASFAGSMSIMWRAAKGTSDAEDAFAFSPHASYWIAAMSDAGCEINDAGGGNWNEGDHDPRHTWAVKQTTLAVVIGLTALMK
jgi:hypothetical protein